jgi:hypothetical protein
MFLLLVLAKIAPLFAAGCNQKAPTVRSDNGSALSELCKQVVPACTK